MMADTGEQAWAHIEDPIGFDFFGFDFDFTDYADDIWFESDGSLKDAMLTSPSPSPPTVEMSQRSSSNHVIRKRSGNNTTNTNEEEDPAAKLKRQKIEQYASAMRKVSSTTSSTSSTPTASVAASHEESKSKATTHTHATSTKRLKKKAKVAKSNAYLPPVIAPNDIRRSLTKVLINGFNSCDIRVIKKTIEETTLEDMIAVHRYEGMQNPYGRNITRVQGRNAYIDMWSALIKSAPDFLFDVLETRAFYDPSTFHMIVASKFSWFGTRVMDVKYTTKVAVATEGTTEGTKAVEETASNTLATKEDIKTTETNSAIDESIFSSATSNEFDTEAASGIPSSAELNSTGKFYVDAIPLQQKLQMSCNGTFLVYINTDYLQEALKKQQQTADEASTPVPNIPIDPAHIGKIFKLEFIYTSSDEKLI